MSTYQLVDLIQKAKCVEAIGFIEEWINEEKNEASPMLADMALVKKCELISTQYLIEE